MKWNTHHAHIFDFKLKSEVKQFVTTHPKNSQKVQIKNLFSINSLLERENYIL